MLAKLLTQPYKTQYFQDNILKHTLIFQYIITQLKLHYISLLPSKLVHTYPCMLFFLMIQIAHLPGFWLSSFSHRSSFSGAFSETQNQGRNIDTDKIQAYIIPVLTVLYFSAPHQSCPSAVLWLIINISVFPCCLSRKRYPAFRRRSQKKTSKRITL